MLNRSQIYTLLTLRKHGDNIFLNKLPIELIREISNAGQSPNSNISKALKYAAYARKEDIEALKIMLDNEPRLVLEAGNVITPGGLDVRRVTLYEFALGAGDPELAELIGSYFAKIPNGEKEKAEQYERYRPHIEGMLKQKPYDLTPLINLIKKASFQDVTALLNKDMTHNSELRDAIVQFRKDHAPGILIKPRMHYNYRSLQHALYMLDREWDNLFQTSGSNLDKIRLVWRQLIGFEMRRLPGIDRCVIAQGIYDVTYKKKPLERSYKLNETASDFFPVTMTDDSLDGQLGGDFAIDVSGYHNRFWCARVCIAGDDMDRLIVDKYFALTALKPLRSEKILCQIL